MEPSVAATSKRRCILSSESLRSQAFRIQSADPVFHYLTRSLRLRPNDEVECIDGLGGGRRLRLVDFGRESLSGEWLEAVQEHARPPGPYPLPILARLKGQDNDEAVRFLGELGLPELRLYTADHDACHRAEAPMERWQRISQEACRQSGGYHFLQIRLSANLEDALSDLEAMPLYYGQEGVERPGRLPPTGTVVVGPEGGFSTAERQVLERRNAQPLCLGWGVLRARSAGLALPAVLSLGLGS